MASPEQCRFLRFDGACKSAPRPRWAITLGTNVIKDWTQKIPSEATIIFMSITGQKYGCAGRQGLRKENRIGKQKSCDGYQPRG